MRVGFIGLGIMGRPMALHLLNACHQRFVQARSQLPTAVAASAAVPSASAAGVALPQPANAAQLLQACDANGMADLDHSARMKVKALELMVDHQVAEG